ncbi:MAG TPA: DNA-binding protein [bacterium]
MLHKLSILRQREAAALLKAEQWSGAYYLIGYAVECALKACVAKQVQRFDFPDKKLAIEAFTHDFEKLVKIAGLEQELQKDLKSSPALELNWAVVKDWSEEARYELGITEPQARNLFTACTIRTNGVLGWIKQRW